MFTLLSVELGSIALTKDLLGSVQETDWVKRGENITLDELWGETKNSSMTLFFCVCSYANKSLAFMLQNMMSVSDKFNIEEI